MCSVSLLIQYFKDRRDVLIGSGRAHPSLRTGYYFCHAGILTANYANEVAKQERQRCYRRIAPGQLW
jgi:hypothetical protein